MRALRIAIFLIAAITLGGTAAPHGVSRDFFFAFSKLDRADWYVSDGWTNGDHQSCEWRSDALSTANGDLTLRVSDRGGKLRALGCAELHTPTRYGYGVYEARLRSAAGSGLNTAFFTYVGPPAGVSQWDEIDFEFLGKDTHSVQINYYADAQGGHEVVVPLGFDSAADFHNYAIEWTPTHIAWYVDGKRVYQTQSGAALPRNSGSLFLSLWSGSNAEDAWLGPLRYERPATAQVAWAAFTPLGQSCLFPESQTCGVRQAFND